MQKQWLYEIYKDIEDIHGVPEIPADIASALKFELRDYQQRAVRRSYRKPKIPQK